MSLSRMSCRLLGRRGSMVGVGYCSYMYGGWVR